MTNKITGLKPEAQYNAPMIHKETKYRLTLHPGSKSGVGQTLNASVPCMLEHACAIDGLNKDRLYSRCLRLYSSDSAVL